MMTRSNIHECFVPVLLFETFLLIDVIVVGKNQILEVVVRGGGEIGFLGQVGTSGRN